MKRQIFIVLAVVVLFTGLLTLSSIASTNAPTYEVICDNLNEPGCFTKHQTAGDWGYVNPSTGHNEYTYAQHAYWTPNSYNNPLDWAKWTPNLTQEGKYDIYIWYPHFPGNYPETNTAHYQVHHSDGDSHFTWNQSINYGGWRKLTTVCCPAGTTCYVKLTDETHESTNTRRVWFDAVKFTRVGTCEEPPPPSGYGNITGRVTSSGSGVKGARVSVGGKVGNTNSNGDYTLNHIPEGTHTLRVSASGYYSYKGQVSIQSDATTTRNVTLSRVRADGFRLPFPGGTRYLCTQGNGGSSHQGKYHYAFDWGMRVGSPVVALRDGRVVYVRQNSYRGGCSSAYINDANLVIIRHADNTESVYVHLKANSVPVRVNQFVKSGQIIGRVGLSGWVCGTHLHHYVRRAGRYYSIPTSFLDVSVHNGVPRYRYSYTSGNYLSGLSAHSTEPLATVEDTDPPEGGVEFRLTAQPTHTVQLIAYDYASDEIQMRLASTQEGLQAASWQTSSDEVEWTLPQIWVQYKDGADNVSTVYSDTIDAIAYEKIQANFAVSPTVCVDAPVPLDNQTVPFCEQCGWEWDFGNGMTSLEAYPSFPDAVYAEPGVYTITLTARGASNVSSASQQVTALSSLSPDFTLVRSNTTITVTSSVQDADSWEWDFGDGITATGRIATHTYTAITQTYPVRLVVTGSNGCVGIGHQYVQSWEVYLPMTVKE